MITMVDVRKQSELTKLDDDGDDNLRPTQTSNFRRLLATLAQHTMIITQRFVAWLTRTNSCAFLKPKHSTGIYIFDLDGLCAPAKTTYSYSYILKTFLHFISSAPSTAYKQIITIAGRRLHNVTPQRYDATNQPNTLMLLYFTLARKRHYRRSCAPFVTIHFYSPLFATQICTHQTNHNTMATTRRLATNTRAQLSRFFPFENAY